MKYTLPLAFCQPELGEWPWGVFHLGGVEEGNEEPISRKWWGKNL